MQITCASALPFRRQGKPSKALQRMQVLVGVAKPSSFWSSRMPSGRWKGLRPMPVSLSDSSAILGSCFTGGIGIRLAGRRLGRILAARAMDVEQRLGRVVIGREVVVLERPRGRDAAGMDDLVEIALAQPEQRRAIDLGIAADIVMERGLKAVARRVGPCLVGLVLAVDEDGLGAPVRFLARQIIAAFEDQNALSGRREPLRERSAAGAAADNDQIIFVHLEAPKYVNVGGACLLHQGAKMMRKTRNCMPRTDL